MQPENGVAEVGNRLVRESKSRIKVAKVARPSANE